jgi:fatty-acyl-CoA synthase
MIDIAALAERPVVDHDHVMLGLMQDMPLTTNWIFDRGTQFYGTKTVTTKTATGLERKSFADVAAETRRVAAVLDSLDLSDDARVGTFAWNTARHLGLYFAIPGTGRVMHTLNIRYFPEQLIYTVDHAEDEAVFVDRSLLPLFGKYLPELQTVKHVIVMDDGAPCEVPDDPRILHYDELVGAADQIDFSDRVSDERQAAAICYTTGTTGHPKGVVYSHRSTWLHSFATTSTSVFGLSESDRILPVVPMFHANAWGIPYAGFLAGASLVMPGPDLSPQGLITLLESERVTVTAGVPTIWMGMVPLLSDHDLSSLRTVICGGSAVPKALSEAWRDKIGLPISQAWGMTEMSPLGTLGTMKPHVEAMPYEKQLDYKCKQGHPPFGVEMKIVGDDEKGLPRDGKAFGRLKVRGPAVAKAYFRGEGEASFDAEGWFDTGDVATIDADGYMTITDRAKDVIKSGGEWISTIEIENIAVGHPAVAEAAVIGVAHPKWDERPLLVIVLKSGQSATREELLAYLTGKIAKWWMPDDVVFVDEIPHTATGKIQKMTLREKFGKYRLPTAAA